RAEQPREELRPAAELAHHAPPEPAPSLAEEQRAGEGVGEAGEAPARALVAREVAVEQRAGERLRLLERQAEPFAGDRVEVAAGVAHQGHAAAHQAPRALRER